MTHPAPENKEKFLVWLRQEATSEDIEKLIEVSNARALRVWAESGPLSLVPPKHLALLLEHAPFASTLLANRSDLPEPMAFKLARYGLDQLSNQESGRAPVLLSELLEKQFDGCWPENLKRELLGQVNAHYSQNRFSVGHVATHLLLMARTGLCQEDFEYLWKMNQTHSKLLQSLVTHKDAPDKLVGKIAQESSSPQLLSALSTHLQTARITAVRDAIVSQGNTRIIQELLETAPEPGFNRVIARLLGEHPQAALELAERMPDVLEQHLAGEALSSALDSESTLVREAALRLSRFCDRAPESWESPGPVRGR